MHRLAAVAVAAAVLAFSSSLFAQEFESFAGLRLQFEAPGARSAAMGGASVASSDSFDAVTNPAALARQQKRTAAIELRRSASETEYLTGGTIGSFTSSQFENSSSGVRSAMVVLPGHLATWALTYDEPINTSMNTLPLGRGNEIITIGVRGNELVRVDDCPPPTGIGSDCWFALFSAPAIMPAQARLRIRRYGAAGATAVGRLSFGGAVQYAQIEEAFDAVATAQRANRGEFTWSAGSQFELSPRVRLGAAYRSGAAYDAERRFQTPFGELFVDSSLRTPSSYAAGIAADLTPSLTFAADAVRVRYSEMTEGAMASYTTTPVVGAIFYHAPDVTELHAGLEYRLPTRLPVALRAGWWHDPAHRIHATGASPFAELVNQIMLRDTDENHMTAGIGVGDRVRFDAAFDRSENTTRASLALSSTF